MAYVMGICVYRHIYILYMYMGYAIDAGFNQLRVCDSTWLNTRISPKGKQRSAPETTAILLSLFVHVRFRKESKKKKNMVRNV